MLCHIKVPCAEKPHFLCLYNIEWVGFKLHTLPALPDKTSSAVMASVHSYCTNSAITPLTTQSRVQWGCFIKKI